MKDIVSKEDILQEINLAIEHINAELQIIDLESTNVAVAVIISVIFMFSSIIYTGGIHGDSIYPYNVTLVIENSSLPFQRNDLTIQLANTSTIRYLSFGESGFYLVLLLSSYGFYYSILISLLSSFGLNQTNSLEFIPVLKAEKNVGKTLILILLVVLLSNAIVMFSSFPSFIKGPIKETLLLSLFLFIITVFTLIILTGLLVWSIPTKITKKKQQYQTPKHTFISGIVIMLTIIATVLYLKYYLKSVENIEILPTPPSLKGMPILYIGVYYVVALVFFVIIVVPLFRHYNHVETKKTIAEHLLNLIHLKELVLKSNVRATIWRYPTVKTQQGNIILDKLEVYTIKFKPMGEPSIETMEFKIFKT